MIKPHCTAVSLAMGVMLVSVESRLPPATPRIEDHEQHEFDGIGEQRLLFRVARACRPRSAQVHSHRRNRLFASRPSRPQHVEARTRDDGREPPSEILYRARVSAVQSQLRFLRSVFRVAERPKHPVTWPRGKWQGSG